jgi:predicted signal transduction protein with EAL and GGDEF domain
MTESSLIQDLNPALGVLGSLRRLGVSLLMDDFGTGYSSLNHLHSFPFDVLKIDCSFVRRMTEGDQPLQIVRTIIELARVLGMHVVAEGIETVEMPARTGISVRTPHERQGYDPTAAASRSHPPRAGSRRSRLRLTASHCRGGFCAGEFFCQVLFWDVRQVCPFLE